MAPIPASLAECHLRVERVPPDLRIGKVDQTRNVASCERMQDPTGRVLQQLFQPMNNDAAERNHHQRSQGADHQADHREHKVLEQHTEG